MGLQGGFLLSKKPLSIQASVYTNSENAIAVPDEQQNHVGL
jgi:hypothetical protein